VAPLAITFGLLLGILGAGFYYATGMEHITALIPAFFGIALLILGILAISPNRRMHAMHGAALVGLVGLIIPAYRVVSGLVRDTDMKPSAVAEQVAMASLCGVFLVLCVKSFIDARRRRRQQGAGTID